MIEARGLIILSFNSASIDSIHKQYIATGTLAEKMSNDKKK